jgi:hypothetical protein
MEAVYPLENRGLSELHGVTALHTQCGEKLKSNEESAVCFAFRTTYKPVAETIRCYGSNITKPYGIATGYTTGNRFQVGVRFFFPA